MPAARCILLQPFRPNRAISQDSAWLEPEHQRFLRAWVFDAGLAAAPCFFAAPRAARASLTAAVCAGAAFLRLPPSAGGSDRTRGPPLSPTDLSASEGRLVGDLMGVSRTRRKSILRASRSTRLTCTRTRSDRR